MDYKKAFEHLIKIAEKQQKIIEKLAQQLPGGGEVDYSGGAAPGGPASAPPPQKLAPKQQLTTHEATAILNALPTQVKAKVANLEVHGHEVYVQFGPQGGTQQDFNTILQTVNNLASQNILPAKQYQVKEY